MSEIRIPLLGEKVPHLLQQQLMV